MIAIQMDFWKEAPTEIDFLKAELEQMKESMNKVRKSLFAKNGEHAKILLDISARLEILERNICQGKIYESSNITEKKTY